MRGKRIYFYALKEDFLENIRLVEEKLGGIKYVKEKIYDKPEMEIYNSIMEIPEIGLIKEGVFDGNFQRQWSYSIAKKEKDFIFEEVELSSGGLNYHIKNIKGFLELKPSGIVFKTNIVLKGHLMVLSDDEEIQSIFKELKKSMLKDMMIVKKGHEYVGKSVIENKEKYRLPYGGIESNPDWDYDISEAVWKKKK